MKVNNEKQFISMKQLYAFGKKRKIDLSLSENPLGCSPVVAMALGKTNFQINDYPQPNGSFLKKKLASFNGLKTANFFVANGSEAIICSLPRLFSNSDGEVLIPNLTFPMFKTSSLLAGLKVIEIPMTKSLKINLNKFEQLITENTKIIFLCNPNNPTGSILSKKKILAFLKKISKNILLIIDEANIEFGGESMIGEVKNNRNLVVLRTFSKGFGLANLRVGFAVANEKIVNQLERISQPFATSGLSELLTSVALTDQNFIQQTKKFISQQRRLIKKQLVSFGFKVFPSQANNLFVKLPGNISVQKFEQALDRNNISLVMGKSFSGFDNQFFRVSIRDEKTNQKFLKFIEKISDTD